MTATVIPMRPRRCQSCRPAGPGHIWCHARLAAVGMGSACGCGCWDRAGRLTAAAAAEEARLRPDGYAAHLRTVAAFAAALGGSGL